MLNVYVYMANVMKVNHYVTNVILAGRENSATYR
jgi:hypothetical protein